MTLCLSSIVLVQSAYQFQTFDYQDGNCQGKVLNSTAFDINTCVNSPIDMYPTMSINLNPDTYQYAISLYPNSNCAGGAAAMVYGMGQECLPDQQLVTNVRFQIVAPITTPCRIQIYYATDCSGPLETEYGFVPNVCRPSMLPWWIAQNSQQFIVEPSGGYSFVRYYDTECTRPADNRTGVLGTCGTGMLAKCNKEYLIEQQ